jgi:hypothetical protein
MSVTPLRSPSTISDLTGWFTGFSVEMNASNQLTRWRDLSGKGNHVESGAIRSGSINLSASAINENVYDSPSTADAKLGVTPFPFLYGSTGAGLQFPTTMMTTTSNYTLFHVARYYKPGDAVPTRRRIFDGVTSNWLSGFHSSKSGVAYHNSWLTSQTDIHGDTWVLSTDQRDMYRSNGTDRTSSVYSNGASDQLSINYGSHTGSGTESETSDWAVAEVIVYDRELTSAEYQAVEAYLNAKYFSTNLEIPSTGPISLMSFATYLFDGTGYPISLQSLASNFGLTSSIGFSDFRGEAQIPRVSPVVVATSDLPTQVFTIRGPSFTSVPSIKFVGVDGIPHDVSSTTYVSQGVATFTLGNLTSAQLANQPFKIKIGSDTSIDTISSFISLPTRRENESLTYDLNNDLGVSPYTRTGTLPDGLSISGGILSGTLTTPDTYDFTLTSQLILAPDGNWTQQAKINATDKDDRDFFGRSVAISSDGNTAIVGAYQEDPGGNDYINAGSAYIFTRDSNGNWTQQAKINATDNEANDFFGWSVAISGDGNTAIVGAPDEDPGGTSYINAGSAYIFTRDSNGSWIQQAKINATVKDDRDNFGWSVAISGDGNTAIVGANSEDPGGNDYVNAGSAYIFTRSNGSWTQQAKINATDKEANDFFGYSVAISGDGNTAIVGAPDEDPGGTSYINAGSAYIFTRSNGSWIQQAKIDATDKEANDFFGWSVAISGDGNTAIVGAYREDPGGNDYVDAGSAYIFTRNSNGSWTQQAKIDADDKTSSDFFGWSVAISSDGNTAIVGARDDAPGGISAITGSAYIFTRSNGSWTQQAKINASDKAGGDNFGWSVAISGDGNTTIVGAYTEDPGGNDYVDAGSAYVFALPLLSRDYRMVVTN